MRSIALPRTAPLRNPEPSLPPRALGLVIGIFEALAGRRPLHQIRPHLTPDAFRALAEYRDSGLIDEIPTGRLRAQHPAPGTVEATASIQVGGRWLACTLRMELAERWCCRHLHLLGLEVRSAAA